MMDKFYFFNSFLDTARAIEDEQLRLEYLMAVAEYGIEGKITENPIIKALMVQTQFTIDRSKELSELKSESMRGNQNARKDWEKQGKQRKTVKTEKNGEKQKKQEEEVEEEYIKKEDISKDISKKESYSFKDFWIDYPHARKSIKHKSESYFKLCNPNEVKKQVWILKRKIKAGLADVKYVPACERWIRDFTPLNEDVVKQDLIGICKWHLNAGGDMKQRSHELKETFGEQQINEIVKAIQQKDKPSFNLKS